MKKELVRYIMTGLSIGFVVTTFSTIVFSGINELSLQLLAWCIASMIYGGSSILFQIESIKNIYITIMHYVICLLTTLGVASFFGWMEAMFVLVVYFTVVYFFIYMIMLLIEKRQVREINRRLRER